MTNLKQAQKISLLNDTFRNTLNGGDVMLTAGITSLPESAQQAILQAVQQFNDFTPDNDPYDEHDFGMVEIHGQRIFFKIDYYEPTLTCGSENPADPAQTRRVLTIMLAEEY